MVDQRNLSSTLVPDLYEIRIESPSDLHCHRGFYAPTSSYRLSSFHHLRLPPPRIAGKRHTKKQQISAVNPVLDELDDVSRKGCLAVDVIEQTEVEVERLNVLKSGKMKELVFKKQNEPGEVYRGSHMDVDSDAARQILISLTESCNVDMSNLLASLDDQITKANERALSRKDILDKVQKRKFASEEEQWLDEYEKDDNRYGAGRGAHKNLKRAEKARILASKTPCEFI
ncbi:hypothetical protein Peur_041217 [Populus x canadensis]